VYPGEPAPTVISRLYQANVIRHPWIFSMMLTLESDRQHLYFGEYQLTMGMTSSQLLHNMTQGKGLVKHRITFVEGWTFDDIRQALSNDKNLKQTLTMASNTSIAPLFGKEKPTSLEGLFYPDTYFFTWGNTDVSVLSTAFQKMQMIMQTTWQRRAPDLPYQNPYQALIVASLIERETSIATEKPIIASVIVNRLQKNMRLQIDPTVQYGLKKPFGYTIMQKDLEKKTAYNTYLIAGLPPTPICMPSQSSIDAALHPARTDYLYYVATGSGGHHFSVTYQEHLQEVKHYHQELRSIKSISAATSGMSML